MLTDSPAVDVCSPRWTMFLRAVSLGRLPLRPSPQLSTTCVPDMIRMQAARWPNAVAVCFGDDSLSYRELETKACQMARQLEPFAARPGKTIAIWLNRSAEFIWSALAVMKTGCAYLPLDTSWPPERVEYILRDADVSAIVTSSAYSPNLPKGNWETVLTDAPSRPRAFTHRNLIPQLGDLAYIVYTSGSTGKPKGVEITHANLAHLIAWHLSAFEVAAADRATLFSSIAFDASVWEVWPYLAAGSSLHIPPEQVRLSPSLLRDWLVSEEITVSFVPTTLAEQLISLDWPARASLRFLLTGSDLLQRYPRPDLPFTLVNNYGPTECTVVSTSGIVPRETKANRFPAIGKAIGGNRVYVLDSNLRPVLKGEIGELCVAGPSVGHGYRNDPALTSAKFLANPFDPAGTEPMYRTGDLVRARTNGDIDFIGRIDDQVKVQGYRVEPNEVRFALTLHPAVQTCLVCGQKTASGTSALIAYLVLQFGCSVSPAELREHLRARLPEYMIPAEFVFLESLPLTTAGKIDRDALLQLRTTKAPPELRHTSKTNIAHRVLLILDELLQQPVRIDDNFFLLGGHSLLGAQLILRIQESFGVLLTLRDIFDHPTAAEIALQVENAQTLVQLTGVTGSPASSGRGA